MSKRLNVYNLVFPSYCDDFIIHGYHFTKTQDYAERLEKLNHLVSFHTEYIVKAVTGSHQITAIVELPNEEQAAVLKYGEVRDELERLINGDIKVKYTALDDILLLLSIFTGRHVFQDASLYDTEPGVILADPRQFLGGSIIFLGLEIENLFAGASAELHYAILDGKVKTRGFEASLNAVYSLVLSRDWLRQYAHGRFLFLLFHTLSSRIMESRFIQYWTICEHLFSVNNSKWLSDQRIHQLPAQEKIGFLLVHYLSFEMIGTKELKQIERWTTIRNKLIHNGWIPDTDSAYEDAVLFINVAECIVLRVLELNPSNIFNTREKLESFLREEKPASKRL